MGKLAPVPGQRYNPAALLIAGKSTSTFILDLICNRSAPFPLHDYLFPKEAIMLPICPACELEIELDDLDVDQGEMIGCPECGADLLVLSIAPIELELVTGDEAEWGEA